MRIALRVPADNDRGPQYMDQALAAIHQANPGRLPLRLEFRQHAGQVILACQVPDELCAVVRGQLYAAYPDARMDVLAEDTDAASPNPSIRATELHLERDLFPIKRYPQFEDAVNRVSADPLTAVLLALSTTKADPTHASIALEARPIYAHRRRHAERIVRRLASPFFRRHHRLAHWYAEWSTAPSWLRRLAAWPVGRLGRHGDHLHHQITMTASRQHDREDDLQAATDKLGKHLFAVRLSIQVITPRGEERRAAAKLREIAGTFGQFGIPRLACFHAMRSRRWRRRPRGFLLSTEELATLWHPPTATVRAPTLGTVDSRELPPPTNVPTRARHPDLAILGQATHRGQVQRFGILPDDRRRHVALVGKTGQGKTTLLRQLIVSDVRSGRGVALLDPHGDLCETLLAAVPRKRTNDVILFDAADPHHPLSFNPLHCPRPEMRPLVASGILSSFKKLYTEFWGPRMEHILRNALLAVLETPGATLLSLLRLLSDARYRQAVTASIADPLVRNFWEKEFAGWPIKFQVEAVAPVQNKLGHFLSSPLLRNILGQSRSSLDLRQVMDNGQILLANLSKGRLGDDASALLGSFLVTSVQLAAMSRADQPETQRRDFFLYVDEFQNFATESFATILSEARKYRLALTLANQYLAQLDDQTKAALFGNIGTLISFQVGADDAETIALQLGGEVTPQDLLQLPRYMAYVRLLIDGLPSRPFSMQTLTPTAATARDRPNIIRRTSRQRYARPAAEVEKEIAAALAG